MTHTVDEYRRRIRLVRLELDDLDELIPHAIDMAYGLRGSSTAETTVAVGGGGVADPTAADPHEYQRIQREVLAGLPAYLAQLYEDVRNVRRRLAGPPRGDRERDTDRPSAPPLIDSQAELSEAYEAQRRRRARGEM